MKSRIFDQKHSYRRNKREIYNLGAYHGWVLAANQRRVILVISLLVVSGVPAFGGACGGLFG